MRLLITLLLFYFGYRVLKNWLFDRLFRHSMENREHPPSEFDDIMVKDPFCNTYFPKRSGVHLHYKGQDLYFCKTECRDGFIAAQKENHGEKNN